MKISKIYFIIALLISVFNYSFAQNTSAQEDKIYDYDAVDEAAIPNKGLENLYRKFGAKAKYPKQARKNKIEGKVYISFIVYENGATSEPEIVHSLGYGCDEETLETFNEINPVWTPGKVNGKNVKVKVVLPFSFKLR